MRAPRHDDPSADQDHHQGASDEEGERLHIGGIEAIAESQNDDPEGGPHDPQPKHYAHDPRLPYDDTSVNGSIGSEFTDEDGEPWDCDNGFPDEPDDDEEDECESSS